MTERCPSRTVEAEAKPTNTGVAADDVVVRSDGIGYHLGIKVREALFSVTMVAHHDMHIVTCTIFDTDMSVHGSV